MRKETHLIWSMSEYTNPLKGEFVPNIVTYVHDEDDEKRPAIVIVPGGGYRMVSYSEGEIVANKFFKRGYNVFVLSYTIVMHEPVKLGLQPLKDLARAISFIRGHAEEFQILEEKVCVCGFSAGGHLTGSLGVHFDEAEIRNIAYEGTEIRPNAMILCYPVISTGRYAHQDSFQALLGTDPTEGGLEYMSLEKHVKRNTPPVFIWNTATDPVVPMENGCLFAEACKKQQVPVELHVFREGPHGYSIADEEWAKGEFGGDYTLNQFFAHVQYHIDHELELPAPCNKLKFPKGTDYREVFRTEPKNFLKGIANASVALWVEMADLWLQQLYAGSR